jgi:4-amino-4-deoxy-L-arabinose transferase-like glycosyltransferase
MTERRPFTLADFLMLLLVLLAGLGTRGWYVWEVDTEAGLREDQVWRVQQARVAAEGDWLDLLVSNIRADGPLRGYRTTTPLGEKEEITAHVAPGYPIVRAYVEQAAQDFGGETLKPVSVVRWLHAVLGALTAGLYFALARRAFDSRVVALLAGLFTALDPFAVINAAELRDGTLASFLLALTLYLGVRAGQQGGPFASLLFGISLAAAALTRAALLPFALVSLLWFLWRTRTLPSGWLSAAVAFLGCLGGLAPWAVRNHREFQEALPMVSTTWYHVWLGNNPQATGGDVAFQAGQAMPSDRRAALFQTGHARRYDGLAADVWQEVSTNPAATVERRLFAGLYFFLSEPVVHRGGILAGSGAEGFVTREAVELGLHGTLFGMLLFGVLGWRWSHSWRRSSMPLQLAALWVPLPYLLAYAPGLHEGRLPLDGVLLTLAAFAIATLIPASGLKPEPLSPTPEATTPTRM